LVDTSALPIFISSRTRDRTNRSRRRNRTDADADTLTLEVPFSMKAADSPKSNYT
jgi:hypothetical protein